MALDLAKGEKSYEQLLMVQKSGWTHVQVGSLSHYLQEI